MGSVSASPVYRQPLSVRVLLAAAVLASGLTAAVYPDGVAMRVVSGVLAVLAMVMLAGPPILTGMQRRRARRGPLEDARPGRCE